MSRSWLTETIARVDDLLNQINGLPDEVRLYLLDRLIPEPEPEVKPAKKSRKKSNKPASKSARASGMAAAINRSLTQQRQVKDGACTFVLDNGAVCNTGDNNPIHDQSFGYAGYHEFQSAPVAHEASAGG